eukprot:scaffold56119_cov66-Phaeocystis_antarctica.AAC.4
MKHGGRAAGGIHTLPTCALRSCETRLWNAVPEGLLLLETVYIYTICQCMSRVRRVPVARGRARDWRACVSRRCRAGARALRGAVEGTVGLDLRSYLYVRDGECVYTNSARGRGAEAPRGLATPGS